MAHAASQLKKRADLELTAAEEEREKEKKKKPRKRSREPKKKVPIGTLSHGSEGGVF